MKSSWLRSPLAWSTVAGLIVFVLIALYLPAQAAMKVIAYFTLQSVVAFVLLEVVNYIKHYGLQRKTEGGKREAFGMMHAWNADNIATNSMLANLQRHSDHHMHAWKPYPTLEPLPGPQLPTGYAGCPFFRFLRCRCAFFSPGCLSAVGTVDIISHQIHPHPSLGESIDMAAEVAHGSCTDLPPIRKKKKCLTAQVHILWMNNTDI